MVLWRSGFSGGGKERECQDMLHFWGVDEDDRVVQCDDTRPAAKEKGAGNVTCKGPWRIPEQKVHHL